MKSRQASKIAKNQILDRNSYRYHTRRKAMATVRRLHKPSFRRAAGRWYISWAVVADLKPGHDWTK